MRQDDMHMAQMGQANGMMPPFLQNIMNFFGGQKQDNEQWGELEFNVGGANGQQQQPQDISLTNGQTNLQR